MLPTDREPGTQRHLCLDKGYDYDDIRQVLQKWGLVAHIPRVMMLPLIIQDISNYRARRWVVERTHSWMNRFRRILIRWEKNVDNYLAMLQFSCAFITFRKARVFG